MNIYFGFDLSSYIYSTISSIVSSISLVLYLTNLSPKLIRSVYSTTCRLSVLLIASQGYVVDVRTNSCRSLSFLFLFLFLYFSIQLYPILYINYVSYTYHAVHIFLNETVIIFLLCIMYQIYFMHDYSYT